MNRFPTIADIKNSSVAELNKHLFDEVQECDAKKRAKYGNKKIEIDGEVFDSLKESRRYIELRMLEIAGEITNLNVHTIFELSVCNYESDFDYYTKENAFIVEDVKSKITRRLSTYRLKKKMMQSELNIEIIEV